jgi:hypothetical protein
VTGKEPSRLPIWFAWTRFSGNVWHYCPVLARICERVRPRKNPVREKTPKKPEISFCLKIRTESTKKHRRRTISGRAA